MKTIICDLQNDDHESKPALKAPPYDVENYCINLHHITHVHLLDVLGMFQLEFFKNSRFGPF